VSEHSRHQRLFSDAQSAAHGLERDPADGRNLAHGVAKHAVEGKDFCLRYGQFVAEAAHELEADARGRALVRSGLEGSHGFRVQARGSLERAFGGEQSATGIQGSLEGYAARKVSDGGFAPESWECGDEFDEAFLRDVLQIRMPGAEDAADLAQEVGPQGGE
jgi:hypothetical protein